MIRFEVQAAGLHIRFLPHFIFEACQIVLYEHFYGIIQSDKVHNKLYKQQNFNENGVISMLNSHAKFHSISGKRRILIAEDEMVNRAILGEILKNEYDIIEACDGDEALEIIREYNETLSLVLLDILMPGKSGFDVLRTMHDDSLLSKIPVIVMTSEKDAEVESLKLGATDFIPKPYPPIDVIHARILRTIELYEDREIIMFTERDALTGLYNKEYFYRYAEQFDNYHKETDTDAIIIDINHFRMINERYGKAYGDEVLRSIGSRIKKIIEPSDGIVCRLESDTFMIYSPHIDDYEAFFDSISSNLTADESSENRVRLRMGVYSNADKAINIERRFDYAKMAADTVKGSLTKVIGIFDDQLHDRQLYAEQLIEDFPIAIREKQFQVFFQPKFDVRPNTPLLAGAEALVRWIHPELGMINPGVFIPLFEDNGLIEQLDTYVWKETAKQIKNWKERFDYAIPISVNVSRIDMYDPELPDNLTEILHEHGLKPGDMMLEVTESAYTKDSGQIIAMADKLREKGFQIEMDDFGTGYSSLNMISSIPIDALKLDMQFIRSAFKEGGNTYMLEVIIGIAGYLSVPVIAEGVETEEQLHALKNLGCDIVQGYFFSRPVPASDFEPFILQKKEAEKAMKDMFLERVAEQNREKDAKIREIKKKYIEEERSGSGQTADDNISDIPEEILISDDRKSIRLRTASFIFVILATISAVALFIADISVSKGYQNIEQAHNRYMSAQLAASDMEAGSDYLTDRVRSFVVSGEIKYLNDFVKEVEKTKTRDKALESLKELIDDENNAAIKNLNNALKLSNELIIVEDHAIRLMMETGNYNKSDFPDKIAKIKLTAAERTMTTGELKQAARSLVFSDYYLEHKNRIRDSVNACTQDLIHSSGQELEQASSSFSFYVKIQIAITILFFIIVLCIIIVVTIFVRRPLAKMVKLMQNQEPVMPEGVEELRFVTRTYNKILFENRDVNEKLSHEASHDPLTGLLNRGAYDLLIEDADKQHIALILIDVDHFKIVNDTYGHSVGDRILRKVADLMRASFRSVDILCRIGGDEFVIVMTRVDSSMSQLVMNKISHINDLLQNPKDDLPPVSLSVGVAFSDRKNPQGDIFRDADTALYQVKEAGRSGCMIF